MGDPDEGIGVDGAIVTGVERDRVPARSEPVLAAAIATLGNRPDVSLYVYGSVATGQAREPTSDVDLIVIGVATAEAVHHGDELSRRFVDRCRAVELSSMPDDVLSAVGDEAYGNRVFLRHYCAHVAGPDPARGLPTFPADARAARGFNGDIGRHADRWRAALDAADRSEGRSVEPMTAFARRLARKTLFAVAGLVSVHDATWTTDRRSAAARWAEIEPVIGDDLRMLLSWSAAGDARDDDHGPDGPPTVAELESALDGIVAHVVHRFEAEIGPWDP